MFERLKNRWKVQSNFQVVIIMTVFAITGTATVYVKQLIFGLIGITPETHLWIKIAFYVPVILTIYNILLLVIGFLFGQFRFFLEFEKKFFSRFMFKKKLTVTEKVKI